MCCGSLFVACIFSVHAQPQCIDVQIGNTEGVTPPAPTSDKRVRLAKQSIFQAGHALNPYMGDAFVFVDAAQYHFDLFARVIIGGSSDLLSTKQSINMYRSSKPYPTMNLNVVKLLKQYDIKQVLSMLENRYSESSLNLMRANGISYAHVPVQDFDGANIATFTEGVKVIEAARAGQRNILLHCRQGIGRTGSFIIAYEMYRVVEYAPSLKDMEAYLSERIRAHGIETREQELALLSYVKHLWVKARGPKTLEEYSKKKRSHSW